jgi:LysR family glycine cleavage system transcriptional activator
MARFLLPIIFLIVIAVRARNNGKAFSHPLGLLMALSPRVLPSTAALNAFRAAARHASLTAAAAELALTQGALSHRIRSLEDALGHRLFRRLPRGLALTPAGRTYLGFVEEALARLADGAAALGVGARKRVLTVSVSPNFAAKWLVPRLGRFIEAHPDLELRIGAAAEHIDFRAGDIDVAVRHGDGVWPTLHVERLCIETILPVASPGYLAQHGRPAGAADLARRVLLHDREPGAWRDWLANQGAPAPGKGDPPGAVFSQASLAIDAAVAGQGIALARSALAALDLAAGRLAPAVAVASPAPFAYWVVCRRDRAAEPPIARFRAWLLDQAAADAHALAAPPPSPGAAPSHASPGAAPSHASPGAAPSHASPGAAPSHASPGARRIPAPRPDGRPARSRRR